MQVPVLIEYGIEHFTPAGRRQKARVHEVVEIELKEASETEAPVAVTWDDAPDEIQAVNWGAYTREKVAHTRWHDGSHWRPILMTELDRSDGPSAEMTADALLGITASKNPYHSFLGNYYPHSPAVPKRLPVGDPEERFGTVSHTQRGPTIKLAKEKFEKLLLVGDTVYVKCPEPTIVPFVVVLQEGQVRHRFLRIVTNESVINRAFGTTPDSVHPVSAFDNAMLDKHLFSLPFVTAIDERRRPEIFAWDSIDEDAVLHETADWKVLEFVRALDNVKFSQATILQLESTAAIRRAISLPKGEERLEKLEQALRQCVVAWEGTYDLEQLALLADAISSRNVEVPFAPAAKGMKGP
ncbi:hypothetical protein OIU34_16840 [Pararhizobium sp. BT-229]|uniref:hypothetical protein n=1 Tax=Pararhizobium sp. BT-229 TaxID=2986923 RepID=UPI0021F7AB94|nr:hypothetical protein [Pararhizobium sp. BT-229]MCV9963572.1 hypothetical protein [Pararhizobium sp. BT-229]